MKAIGDAIKGKDGSENQSAEKASPQLRVFYQGKDGPEIDEAGETC
jgi:hypothetical protein